MSAQELINAWGAAKYGTSGVYTIRVEGDHSGCPTCGYGEFTGLRIYRDDTHVDSMEDVDFASLLNEILAGR